MDPITTAVLAVAPALVAGLVTDAVKDAYVGLKTVIRRKWGEASAIEKAVEEVEARPESSERTEVLREEVAQSGAMNDPEVTTVVAKLIEALKTAGIGGEKITNLKVSISGGTQQGIIGAEHAEVGTMNFGEAKKPAGS